MNNMGLGRIGNYISQGVNSVSAPFHPFGGAVDIIVVEQKDGSFKSSPWYVRFGKFQGVLKAKEKVVKINVNGAEADFHMYLDHKGEAYFLRELGGEEGDPVLCPSSSGEETDEQSRNRKPVKFKSSNYDASLSNSFTQIDVIDGKVVTRTNSRRSRILGLVFGKKSMKNGSSREEEDAPDVVRRDSLERAEFAADLLEVKWSTNLASNRGRKDNASRFSAPNIPGSEADKDLLSNDGRCETYTPLQNSMTNSLNDSVLCGKIGFHNSGIINSKFGFQKLGSSDEDLGVEMSCLDTEHIVETCALGESGLQENYDLNSQTVREIDELGVASANPDENAKCFIPETISPDPESTELDSCLSQKLDEEQVLKEYTNFPGQGVSEDESGEDRVEAFVYRETSETLRAGLHNAGVNLGKALYVSCRGCGEVCVHAATLHQAAELISEVTSVPETSLLVAKEPLDAHEILADGNCGNVSNEAKIIDSKETSSHSIANSLVSETYTQVVTVAPINVSAKEVEPCSICTISGFNNSAYEAQKGENYGDEDKMSKLWHSSKSIGNSQEFRSNNVSTGAITSSSPSEGSEGEQLLFGDLDDFNHGEVKCTESISSDHVEKGNSPSGTSEGNKAVIESVFLNFESYSSPDLFVQENIPNHVEDVIQKSRMVSNCIKIPRSNEVTGKDVERMAESLPNMRFHSDNLVVDDLHHSLGYSLDSNSESSKWTPMRGDSSSCVKPDTDKDIASHTQSTAKDAQILEELKHVPANPAAGNLSSKRSWRGWPFSFKRSKSVQATQPAQNSSRTSGAENSLESSVGMDGEKDVLKTKMKMKKVREITPTPEQLASLNLKQGKNIVTFTFSTAMLGPQQVDARIYLWKWDTRVVISDVDGTITKSDVLGQFMPFVGVDWSQTGVAHLFSAIKENGYQLLFLSARAISQAYHTRQFLFNLKQDGKGLPDGPVVISPDGLFPSLFREVIRRAPHEFKIGCLEDIRVLFPSDRNPFYAGFGNRDTDEISYLKVGIPIGKIFIINPKGEVVVNRRVDSKSYTSLHALVHDMFPPMTSEQEDFNSWNYWKLPPPAIDI